MRTIRWRRQWAIGVAQRSRRALLILALLAPLLALPTRPLGLGRATLAAPPCPEPPPSAPSPTNALPGLPNTGGGGGDGSYCRDHPTDPECPGNGGAVPVGSASAARLDGLLTRVPNLVGAIGLPLFAANGVAPPPCDDLVPGPAPNPTLVSLIPVDVPREAPDVAASVEMPLVRVRANPETGLVNVPTWLWAEGYRGQDLVASRSWSLPYEPTTIQVRYSVRRYLWNFGDGGQIETRSLGQPYPQESDIRNVYGWSSRTEPGGVFHLSLTIEWAVEYRVNGGSPQLLPPVQHRSEMTYPVQELQPIVTGP